VVNSSYLNFYSKKERKFLNSGKVKVRVLPPFQTQGMTLDSVSQLSKHLHELMQKEFDQLNKEIGLDEKYLAEEYARTPEATAHNKKRQQVSEAMRGGDASELAAANMSLDSNLSEDHQRLLDEKSGLSKELDVSSQSSDSNEYDYGDDALTEQESKKLN
jgi:hypothetical protein